MINGTGLALDEAVPPAVTGKAFDEYHLYSLPHVTTLRDGETQQVEFIHVSGVKSEKVYVYDGLVVDWNQDGSINALVLRETENFGIQSQPKVAVMREFKNSTENHLGLPLPKGRIRFYKQDGNLLQFTGENIIDHTPKDELLKLYTGNAFDLTGERRRTNFHENEAARNINESFAIKLRNHKTEPVEIRVVEHLYRWTNWEIVDNSDPFLQTNAQEIEFRVQLKPDEEKTVTYTAQYSW